uniref:Baculovirus J domain protein n=1 Tax=Lymantria dispar multicapsid nuclear polyhedrosis virus TaxID=10449 RepID=A0A1B1MQR7_NPVLD|nr:baculovirus J domain protein [Lymantria dispar multiple nucleopolyhedrovirus]
MDNNEYTNGRNLKRKSGNALFDIPNDYKLKFKCVDRDYNTNDLYQLLKVDRHADESTVRTALNIIFTMNRPSDEKALRLYEFARDVLLSTAARAAYDRILKQKDAITNIETRLQQQQQVNLVAVKQNLDALKNDLNYRDRNDFLSPITNQGGGAGGNVGGVAGDGAGGGGGARKRQPRQRNLAFNRVMIEWRLESSNSNNENVNEAVLREHFLRYGEINALVLCTKRPGCALLEFANIESVTRAKNDDMFTVSDLTENALSKQKFNQQIRDFMNRLQSASDKFERAVQVLESMDIN